MKFATILVSFLALTPTVFAQDSVNVIGEGACGGADACMNNNLIADIVGSTYLNITGDGSCSGAISCSDNSNGSTLSIREACSGGKSDGKDYGTCSLNQGDVTVEGGACSGTSSCSGNTQGIQITGQSCTGTHSCTKNTVRFINFGSVCRGDGSCSNNLAATDVSDSGYFTDFSLNDGACSGLDSCSNGQGAFLAFEGACTGDYSCQAWKVGDNVETDVGTSFTVFQNSCTGDLSCQDLISNNENGYVSVLEGACTGDNACQNIVVPEGAVELTIYEGACTEDNSCQDCQTTVIGAGCQNCESDCSDTGGGSGAYSVGPSIGLIMSILAVVFGGN